MSDFTFSRNLTGVATIFGGADSRGGVEVVDTPEKDVSSGWSVKAEDKSTESSIPFNVLIQQAEKEKIAQEEEQKQKKSQTKDEQASYSDDNTFSQFELDSEYECYDDGGAKRFDYTTVLSRGFHTHSGFSRSRSNDRGFYDRDDKGSIPRSYSNCYDYNVLSPEERYGDGRTNDGDSGFEKYNTGSQRSDSRRRRDSNLSASDKYGDGDRNDSDLGHSEFGRYNTGAQRGDSRFRRESNTSTSSRFSDNRYRRDSNASTSSRFSDNRYRRDSNLSASDKYGDGDRNDSEHSHSEFGKYNTGSQRDDGRFRRGSNASASGRYGDGDRNDSDRGHSEFGRYNTGAQRGDGRNQRDSCLTPAQRYG